MLLGKKINITINQNADKIFSAMSKLKEKIQNKEYDFEHRPNKDTIGDNWKTGYDGVSYAWGVKFGKKDHDREGYAHVLLTNEHSSDGMWLYGPILNSLCPWINDLVEISQGLDFDEIGVMWHSGDALPHIDQPEKDSPVTRMTTILYQEDPLAHLTVWDTERESVDRLRSLTKLRKEIRHEDFYLSPGETYILDVKKPHAVTNTKKRLILSARFNNTIEKVLTHFDKIGPLRLG